MGVLLKFLSFLLVSGLVAQAATQAENGSSHNQRIRPEASSSATVGTWPYQDPGNNYSGMLIPIESLKTPNLNALHQLLQTNRKLIVSAAELLDQDRAQDDLCPTNGPGFLETNFGEFLSAHRKTKLDSRFFCPNGQTEEQRKFHLRCLTHFIMQSLMEDYAKSYGSIVQGLGVEQAEQTLPMDLIEFGTRALSGWGKKYPQNHRSLLMRRVFRAAHEAGRTPPPGDAYDAMLNFFQDNPGADSFAHTEALRSWAQENIKKKLLVDESVALLRSIDEKPRGSAACYQNSAPGEPQTAVFSPIAERGWSASLSGSDKSKYVSEAKANSSATDKALVQTASELKNALQEPFGPTERLAFSQRSAKEREQEIAALWARINSPANHYGFGSGKEKVKFSSASSVARHNFSQVIRHLDAEGKPLPANVNREVLTGLLTAPRDQQIKMSRVVNNLAQLPANELQALLLDNAPGKMDALFVRKTIEALRDPQLTRTQLEKQYGELYRLRTGIPMRTRLMVDDSPGDIASPVERAAVIDLLRNEIAPGPKPEYRNNRVPTYQEEIAAAQRLAAESRANVSTSASGKAPTLGKELAKKPLEELFERANLLEARLVTAERDHARLDALKQNIEKQAGDPQLEPAARTALQTDRDEIIRLQAILKAPGGLQDALRDELNVLNHHLYLSDNSPLALNHPQLVMPCLIGLGNEISSTKYVNGQPEKWNDRDAFKLGPGEKPFPIPESLSKKLFAMRYYELSEYCTGVATKIAQQNTEAYVPWSKKNIRNQPRSQETKELITYFNHFCTGHLLQKAAAVEDKLLNRIGARQISLDDQGNLRPGACFAIDGEGEDLDLIAYHRDCRGLSKVSSRNAQAEWRERILLRRKRRLQQGCNGVACPESPEEPMPDDGTWSVSAVPQSAALTELKDRLAADCAKKYTDPNHFAALPKTGADLVEKFQRTGVSLPTDFKPSDAATIDWSKIRRDSINPVLDKLTYSELQDVVYGIHQQSWKNIERTTPDPKQSELFASLRIQIEPLLHAKRVDAFNKMLATPVGAIGFLNSADVRDQQYLLRDWGINGFATGGSALTKSAETMGWNRAYAEKFHERYTPKEDRFSYPQTLARYAQQLASDAEANEADIKRLLGEIEDHAGVVSKTMGFFGKGFTGGDHAGEKARLDNELRLAKERKETIAKQKERLASLHPKEIATERMRLSQGLTVPNEHGASVVDRILASRATSSGSIAATAPVLGTALEFKFDTEQRLMQYLAGVMRVDIAPKREGLLYADFPLDPFSLKRQTNAATDPKHDAEFKLAIKWLKEHRENIVAAVYDLSKGKPLPPAIKTQMDKYRGENAVWETGKDASSIQLQALTNYLRAVDRALTSTGPGQLNEHLIPTFTETLAANPKSMPLDRIVQFVTKEVESKAKKGTAAAAEMEKIEQTVYSLYGVHLPTASRAAIAVLPTAARNGLAKQLSLLSPDSKDFKEWGRKAFNASSHDLMDRMANPTQVDRTGGTSFDEQIALYTAQQVEIYYGKHYRTLIYDDTDEDWKKALGIFFEKLKNDAAECILPVFPATRDYKNHKWITNLPENPKEFLLKFNVETFHEWLWRVDVGKLAECVMKKENPRGLPEAFFKADDSKLTVAEAEEMRHWIFRNLQQMATEDEGETKFAKPWEAEVLTHLLSDLDRYGNYKEPTKPKPANEVLEESGYYDPSFLYAGVKRYEDAIAKLRTEAQGENGQDARKSLQALAEASRFAREKEKRELPLMNRLAVLEMAQDPVARDAFVEAMTEARSKPSLTPQQTAAISQAIKQPNLGTVERAINEIDPVFSQGKTEMTVIKERQMLLNTLNGWLTDSSTATAEAMYAEARDPLSRLPFLESATKSAPAAGDTDVREVLRTHVKRLWDAAGVPESDTHVDAQRKRTEILRKVETALALQALRNAFAETNGDSQASDRVFKKGRDLLHFLNPGEDEKTLTAQLADARGEVNVNNESNYALAGPFANQNGLDSLGERFHIAQGQLDFEQTTARRKVEESFQSRRLPLTERRGKAMSELNTIESELAYLELDWAKSLEIKKEGFKEGKSLTKEYLEMTNGVAAEVEKKIAALEGKKRMAELAIMTAESELTAVNGELTQALLKVEKDFETRRKASTAIFESQLRSKATQFLSEKLPGNPSAREVTRQTDIFRKYLEQLSLSRRSAESEVAMSDSNEELKKILQVIPEDEEARAAWVTRVNTLQPSLSVPWTYGVDGVALGKQGAAEKIRAHYLDAIKAKEELHRVYGADLAKLLRNWNIHFDGKEFDFSQAKLDQNFLAQRAHWDQFFEKMAPRLASKSNPWQDVEQTLVEKYLAVGGHGHMAVRLEDGEETVPTAMRVSKDAAGHYQLELQPLTNKDSLDKRAETLIAQSKADLKQLPLIIERAASLQNYYNIGIMTLPSFSDMFGEGPQWKANAESIEIRNRLIKAFEELEALGDLEVKDSEWGRVTAGEFARTQKLKVLNELDFLKRIKDKETWDDYVSQWWSAGTLALTYGPGGFTKAGALIKGVAGTGRGATATVARVVGTNAMRVGRVGSFMTTSIPVVRHVLPGYLNGWKISVYSAAGSLPQMKLVQAKQYRDWASADLRRRYALKDPNVTPPEGMDENGDHVISDEEYANFQWKNPRNSDLHHGNFTMGVTFGVQGVVAKRLQLLPLMTKDYGLNLPTMLGGAAVSFTMDKLYGSSTFDASVKAVDRAFYSYQGDDYAAAWAQQKFGTGVVGTSTSFALAAVFNGLQDCVMGGVMHYRAKTFEGQGAGATTSTFGKADGYTAACWQNVMDGIGGTVFASRKAVESAPETLYRRTLLSPQQEIDKLKQIFGNPDQATLNQVYHQAQVWKAQIAVDTLPPDHDSVKQMVRMAGVADADELKRELHRYDSLSIFNRKRDFSDFLRYRKDVSGRIPPGLMP